jgi:spore germination protein GerM
MKQNNNIKIFLIVIFMLLIIGLILLLWLNNLNFKGLLTQTDEKGILLPETEDAQTRQFKLYFGAEGNAWQTETREINIPSPHLEERIKDVLEALLAGPETLRSTPIPKGTQLVRFFLDEDQIAYLDLSEELRQNHPGGTWGEIMTIYSLVNTVMENFHTIQGVKILIMGKEIETLKGHMDTRYPFHFRDQP